MSMVRGARHRGWMGFLAVALAGIAGCSSSAPEEKPAGPRFPGVSLRLGAFDCAEILAGAASVHGEWAASRGGQVSLVEAPLTLETVSQAADVFFFPGERMGELVDLGRLEVLPNEILYPRPRQVEPGAEDQPPARESTTAEEPFNLHDVLPAFGDVACRYGSGCVALPVGGSALVLAYRRDVLESKQLAAAAAAAKVRFEPPRTLDELVALARFLNGRDWDGDGKPDHGIAFAAAPGAANSASNVYLSIAAALGQHPDHFSFLYDGETMAPRIDAPPFVEAMGALLRLGAAGPDSMAKFNAAAARKAFRDGQVALLIDRAERVGQWSGGKPVGVSALPGSSKVYEPLEKKWETPARPNAPTLLLKGGGWLVGVAAGLAGPKREAALDLALYLAGLESVNRLRTERGSPMLPVRAVQLGQGLPDPTQAPDVDARLWMDTVGRVLQADRVVLSPRLPGSSDDLADLDQAIAAALAGTSPESALKQAAARWAERTAKFGPKRRLWHYRRSLGKLATDPSPPPKGA